jgi:hypothetical protein
MPLHVGKGVSGSAEHKDLESPSSLKRLLPTKDGDLTFFFLQGLRDSELFPICSCNISF